MCLERGQPLCPGRTCGLGVFMLALFQAVSHTACWRLSLLHDNAQPFSHNGNIRRLRWQTRETTVSNKKTVFPNEMLMLKKHKLCVYNLFGFLRRKYAWIEKISRHLRPVFHTFSTYFPSPLWFMIWVNICKLQNPERHAYCTHTSDSVDTDS